MKDEGDIFGQTGGDLTVGTLRKILKHLKDDAEVDFGTDDQGNHLVFHSIGVMDDGSLHIELTSDSVR